METGSCLGGQNTTGSLTPTSLSHTLAHYKHTHTHTNTHTRALQTQRLSFYLKDVLFLSLSLSLTHRPCLPSFIIAIPVKNHFVWLSVGYMCSRSVLKHALGCTGKFTHMRYSPLHARHIIFYTIPPKSICRLIPHFKMHYIKKYTKTNGCKHTIDLFSELNGLLSHMVSGLFYSGSMKTVTIEFSRLT